MFEFLEGKKTYIVAFVGLVTVWGAFFTGELVMADAVVRTLELLGIGTLRAGISNSK